MFNKSNLFHKTADTPVTRTTPRPTGNSGTTSSVLAAAEPVSAGTPAASTEVASKAETARFSTIRRSIPFAPVLRTMRRERPVTSATVPVPKC